MLLTYELLHSTSRPEIRVPLQGPNAIKLGFPG
jgi:hypothetical protein